jgi:hypothetical protein
MAIPRMMPSRRIGVALRLGEVVQVEGCVGPAVAGQREVDRR